MAPHSGASILGYRGALSWHDVEIDHVISRQPEVGMQADDMGGRDFPPGSEIAFAVRGSFVFPSLTRGIFHVVVAGKETQFTARILDIGLVVLPGGDLGNKISLRILGGGEDEQ